MNKFPGSSIISKLATGEEKPVLPQVGALLIGFAILCFITSLVMGSSTGEVINVKVNKETVLGPVNNKKANTVYLVKVYQNLGNRASNYIGVDILNANKEFLFAFGKELWWEEGYDSDGRWTEGTKNVEMKITLKDVGEHYFRVSPDGSAGGMHVTVEQRRGSSLPHFTMGIVSIIAGIGLLIYINRETLGEKLANAASD